MSDDVISVNIGEWMDRNQRTFNPNDGFHAGVVHPDMTRDELIAEADRRQDAWLAAERQRLLDEKLDKEPIDCGECSQTARPYKGDYLCYTCRDKLDA